MKQKIKRTIQGLILTCAGVYTSVQPAVLPDSVLSAYSEYNCMFLVLYHESRGESELGQRVVSSVVLNRVKHRSYPSDVCSVVLQKKQFSNVERTFRKQEKTSYNALNQEGEGRVARVAYEALYGAVELPSAYSGATHYHTTNVKPYWSKSMRRVGVVGNHVFYE